MQSERKVTKYLKTKDLNDYKQLQKELNTMMKQKFGKESAFKEVLDIALASIKLNINTMPAITTLLKLLEEEPKSINQEIKSDMVEYYCVKLRAILAKSTQDEFKTPRTKTKSSVKMSAAKQSLRRQDTDEETESEEDLDDDFNIVSKRLMMRSAQDQIKK